MHEKGHLSLFDLAAFFLAGGKLWAASTPLRLVCVKYSVDISGHVALTRLRIPSSLDSLDMQTMSDKNRKRTLFKACQHLQLAFSI